MGSREEELRAIVRDLGVGPYFLGTFDKRFPGFLNNSKPSCAIVNTAGRETGGAHWLALAWFPKSKAFYFFDPFGFSDSKLKQIYEFEYEGLLRRSALAATGDGCINLVKSSESVQGPNSAACGLFCCMFLHAFAHWPHSPMTHNPTMDLLTGVPNHNIMSPSAQPTLRENQVKLYKFLAAHSQYFRTHRPQIERDTSFNKLLESKLQ
ncbi:protease [Bovine mastadenovirus A]|uniref:protease n=1 Tax=Bovine mastadenovirus A TaxID=129953 RepID=UPI0000443F93|nr:protease [Bovine mastadenovirus A]